MTTTQNTTITLPADEIAFLLNLAQIACEETRTTDDERARLDSLRGIVEDTEMPLDGMPQSEVYLLVKGSGWDGSEVVRAFADQAEATKTMKILNEFSSDHFDVEPIAYER